MPKLLEIKITALSWGCDFESQLSAFSKSQRFWDAKPPKNQGTKIWVDSACAETVLVFWSNVLLVFQLPRFPQELSCLVQGLNVHCLVGGEKTINRRTHKHFSDGPCGRKLASDHGRKSRQPRVFAATATTGHKELDPRAIFYIRAVGVLYLGGEKKPINTKHITYSNSVLTLYG